jgi:hypothetical protein
MERLGGRGRRGGRESEMDREREREIESLRDRDRERGGVCVCEERRERGDMVVWGKNAPLASALITAAT